MEQRNRQIRSLQNQLQDKQSAYQDLQHDYDDQVTRIQDLEQTCVARSAKVSQLVQVIAAKKTSEMQEILLEKSLQVADLVQERHKLERDIVNLEEELAMTKVTATKLKQDRDKNNKLLLELSDIVRTLNTIAVEYEKVDSKATDSSESSTSGASSNSSMPMNQPLRNVKRKIQAIEQDRQRLVQEREMLRVENEAKDVQIAALEASFQLMNDKTRSKDEREVSDVRGRCSQPSTKSRGAQQGVDRVSDDQSREVSYEDFVEEKKDDDGVYASATNSSTKDNNSKHVIYTDMGRSLSIVEENVSSTSSSSSSGSETSSSSFSTLEAPPPNSVSLKEHEELKQKFDKALDVIEKLRNELSKRIKKEEKNSKSGGTGLTMPSDLEDPEAAARRAAELCSLKQQLDDSNKNIERLKDELGQTRLEHDQISRDNQSLIQELRREMEERREKHEITLHESQRELSEVRKMNEILKQQYEDLETEYTMKIESLQQQRHDSQTETEEKISDLHQSHADLMEGRTREHTEAMDAQHKTLQDLKFEYDTFLEVHLKAEDIAKKEKELYREALKKIVALESDLLEAENKMAAMVIAHEEELGSVKEKKQEAIQKYNKLKHGYELLVAKHASETQDASANFEQLQRQLKSTISDYERRIEEFERNRKEVRIDFNNALIDHGKKLQSAEFQYLQLKAKYEAMAQEHRRQLEEVKTTGETALLESMEKLKIEYREEKEQQALNFQKLLEQQRNDAVLEAERMKSASDSELEKVKADSRRFLKQRQAELLDILDQCQRSKEESEANLKQQLEEARESMSTLQADTAKQLEKQQYEAEDLLDKAQTELKLEIDRLMAENSILQEHKQEGDDMKVLYRELASSYHSSLVKIEMLLKASKKHGVTKTKDCTELWEKSGSVMEKIRALEDQAGKPSTTAPGVGVPKRVTVDPTFQRDFNALVRRLGLQTDSESVKKEEDWHHESNSIGCSSISLESILARKNSQSAQNGVDADSTGATDNMSSTRDDGAQINQSKLETTSSITEVSPIIQDLICHFVRMKAVNTLIIQQFEMPNLCTDHSNVKVDTPPRPGDALPICSQNNCTAPIFDAHVEAQKMQAENIRHIVKETSAEIMLQAREKDFRLLERQFLSLKKKVEEALHVESSNASNEREALPTSIEMGTSKDHAMYPLGLALSSVSSDAGASCDVLTFDLSGVDCLRKQLLGAELKAEISKRKLESSRMQAYEARKQRVEGRKSLEKAINRLQNVNRNDFGKQLDSTAQCSNNAQATSLCPISEIQVDSCNDTAIVSYLDGVNPRRDFQQREIQMSQSILSIQDELKQAKEEAKIAKQKQLEREENLRDVIMQYKMLQKEHKKLTRTLNQPSIETLLPEENTSMCSENLYVELVNECDTAQATIHNIHEKLETVQQSLRNAQENQGSRRDAIDQYKILQNEFLSALEDKKTLEKVLYDEKTDSAGDASPSMPFLSVDGALVESPNARVEAKYTTHRGNGATSNTPESRTVGTVQQRILMLESAHSKLTLPPSNPSSLDYKLECDDQRKEPSQNFNGKNKKNKKGKKMGFFRANRMNFASKLPTLSSKTTENKATP